MEEEVMELDEVLEQVLNYAVDEAKTKLIEEGVFAPFTVVVEGENMYIESFPGDEMESIEANAIDVIKTASSFATHYVFCFDGVIDTDAGMLDAIIVKCAERDMDEALVIAQIYKEEGDLLEFEDMMAFVQSEPSYFDADIVAKVEEEEFARAQQAMMSQPQE